MDVKELRKISVVMGNRWGMMPDKVNSQILGSFINK
jgi:hypothetical protein